MNRAKLRIFLVLLLSLSFWACGSSGGGDASSIFSAFNRTFGDPNSRSGDKPSPTPTPPQYGPGTLWSDSTTWPNQEIPGAGAMVMIPAGKTIVLDTDTASLGSLMIEGTLEADPTQDVSLTSGSIMIHDGGTLQIGSETQPFPRKAVITLNGARSPHTARTQDNGLSNDARSRGLMVMPGGRLILQGQVNGIHKTKLNQHANANDSTFQLAEAVTWRAGDQIAISITDFYDVGETEILTLAADSNGSSLTTTTPIQTFRWGRLQYPLNNPVNGSAMSLSQGTFTPATPQTPTVLDQRAKVALLTRNIVVQGADDSDWNSLGFGAHTMVMGLNSVAQIDGVEFRRGGQRQAMGRYPFHWHMLSYNGNGEYLGDVNRDHHYIRNSAIWDSENRAVTVHGTNNALVSNNTAVDIKGHAFFMEDGVERRNRIEYNLAMKVRDPGQDHRMKVSDRLAAGFWITNPDTEFVGNSGSDAMVGIWNAFAERPFGASKNVSMVPNSLPILLHENNEGHSNRLQGIMTDRPAIDEAGNFSTVRYSPEPDGRFDLVGNITWKNRDGYSHRTGVPHYIGWTVADNNGIDFTGATSHHALIAHTLFIGESLNNATPFTRVRRGTRSYHHTVDVQDITVINYYHSEPMIGYSIGHSTNFIAGGFFETSDFYLLGVSKGMMRNHNWRIINSSPGYLTPSPYFDGAPLLVQSHNQYRNWSVAEAMWDPFGYWGPAENYYISDHPFYTHDLSANAVSIDVQDRNGTLHQIGWSTPDHFLGIDAIRTEYDSGRYSGGTQAVRAERLNRQNMSVVAEHTIGPGSETIFFPGFHEFTLQNEGMYRITFPGEPIPREFIWTGISNGYRATDELILALPFDGNRTVSCRIEAGYIEEPAAHQLQFITNLQNTGTSLSDVLQDPSGLTMWHDQSNDLIWMKYKGGRPNNIWSGYGPLADRRLYDPQTIRCQRV